MRAPLEDRIWQYLDVGDCWEWTRSKSGGYGTVWDPRQGRVVRVHRWVYEHLVSPIASDRQLDHLCRNRACANPDHLEQVTLRVNVKRGAGGKLQPRAVRCPRGHEYHRTPSGKAKCRPCENQWHRERRLLKKSHDQRNRGDEVRGDTQQNLPVQHRS